MVKENLPGERLRFLPVLSLDAVCWCSAAVPALGLVPLDSLPDMFFGIPENLRALRLGISLLAIFRGRSYFADAETFCNKLKQFVIFGLSESLETLVS